MRRASRARWSPTPLRDLPGRRGRSLVGATSRRAAAAALARRPAPGDLVLTVRRRRRHRARPRLVARRAAARDAAARRVSLAPTRRRGATRSPRPTRASASARLAHRRRPWRRAPARSRAGGRRRRAPAARCWLVGWSPRASAVARRSQVTGVDRRRGGRPVAATRRRRRRAPRWPGWTSRPSRERVRDPAHRRRGLGRARAGRPRWSSDVVAAQPALVRARTLRVNLRLWIRRGSLRHRDASAPAGVPLVTAAARRGRDPGGPRGRARAARRPAARAGRPGVRHHGEQRQPGDVHAGRRARRLGRRARTRRARSPILDARCCPTEGPTVIDVSAPRHPVTR